MRDAFLRRLEPGESGLTLLLDDLPFIDSASRIGLDALQARVGTLRIVATRRVAGDGAQAGAPPTGASSAMSAGAEREHATDVPALAGWSSLRLAPLGDAEMRALLAPIALDDERVHDAARVLGAGNPLLAMQAALALQDAGADEPMHDVASIAATRLSDLDAGETLILRAASTVNRPLAPDILAAICAHVVPGDITRGAIERLMAKRLLVAVETRDATAFTTAHALVSDATRARMPRSVLEGFSDGAARRLRAGARTGALKDVTDGELAALWLAAGARGRAAIAFARAGRRAEEIGAQGPAFAAFDAAIEAAEGGASLRPARWRAFRAAANWGLGRVAQAALDADACLAHRRVRRFRRRHGDALLTAAAIRAETAQFQGDLGAILSSNALTLAFARDADDRQQAQGRAYAFWGYLAGLARLGALSRALHDRGARVPAGGDPRAAGFALAARAVVDLSFARWRDAERALAAAADACREPPEPHLSEVVDTLYGLGRYFQGDCTEALAAFDRLHAKARAREHTLHLGWAAYARAEARIALGAPAEALRELDLAEAWLAPNGDAQSTLICAGLRPQALWRLGRIEEAMASAIAGLETHVPPTNFGSLEGYAGPAHVLAMAAAQSGPWKTGERARTESHARKALKALEGYALVFPIGRPRSAIVRAWLAARTDPAQARAQAKRAADLACRMGMSVEARHAEEALSFLRSHDAIAQTRERERTS